MSATGHNAMCRHNNSTGSYNTAVWKLRGPRIKYHWDNMV